MPEWIDAKISVGNIVTIGVLLTGGIFGYASLQSRTDTNEKDIAELKIQYERRETALQREQNIINRMDDMRTRMERIERKLDVLR